MSDVLEHTTPGWRRDPSGRYEWRWWDGSGWTNRVANAAHADPRTIPAESPTLAVPAPATTSAAAVAAAPPDPHTALHASPADWSPAPPAPVGGETATTTASAEPLADPFAALRSPRNGAPAPEVARSSGAPVAPVEPLGFGAPPDGAVSPVGPVRTYPSAHDGSSGTTWDGPYVPEVSPAPSGSAPKRRGGILGAATAFVRSFWEQEESYHSPKAGAQLPPHPKQHELAPPPNYGRAGLVMLAAAAVAVGAYLPWITYRIDEISYHRTGYELGATWGFVLAAAAFSIAALLGARHRVMGWVTMGMSVVVAGMVSIRLLDVHDQVVHLNAGPTVSAEVGIGLWIMLAAAAIGLIAAFRLDTPAQIV